MHLMLNFDYHIRICRYKRFSEVNLIVISPIKIISNGLNMAHLPSIKKMVWDARGFCEDTVLHIVIEKFP